ncbi:hypothetical protein [Natronoflexus pectinivorans]|uniref:Uncharacterized protein n=1 Tax=Natronoflexus pectinivorans TaxID=682526 RepID=A0A4R2GL91_9BACT|nr:hypothetical protein [Natronoflexus pectinivorans]TCO09356.1 hypothetical protein EV194_103269 [Natronoflexus pectinivorans]
MSNSYETDKGEVYVYTGATQQNEQSKCGCGGNCACKSGSGGSCKCGGNCKCK